MVLGFEQRAYRLVTSLSYDLVESTSLMQQIGAEAYALLIERVHSVFAGIAEQFGGAVDMPQGDDGCMCYFGALSVSEHAKEAALMSALAMQKVAKANNWAVRIGLAYGQVAVYKYQPVGATVHLAARLQKIAKNQQVLVAGELVALTAKRFVFEPIDLPYQIKGFDEAPAVFELIGKENLRLLHFGLSKRDTPPYLHGRQSLLKKLHDHWLKVGMGQGVGVSLVGEAGIGKTALLENFIARTKHAKRGVVVLRCFQEKQNRAYAPIVDILMHWTQIQDSDDVDARLQKIRSKVQFLSLSNEQLWAIYFLLEMQAHFPSEVLVRTEKPQDYEGLIFRAIATWLRIRSKKSPFLLVFEDLHWCDSSTLGLLAYLQGQIQSFFGMLLTTQRSSKAVDFDPDSGKVVYEIDRLNFEESSALIQHLFEKQTPFDFQTMDKIAERANGIPLFIHESVRLCRAAEVARQQKSTQEVNVERPVVVWNKPEIGFGAQEILMQRIDALGKLKILAQIASAIGAEFDPELLLQVVNHYGLGFNRHGIATQMDELVQEDILCIRAVDPLTVYGFSHNLIQDVAYRSMWESDRKKLHLNIVAVYQEYFPDLSDSQPGLIARHWAAAGDYFQAVTYLLKAGQLNKRRGAHGVCIRCCEEALDLLQELPQDDVRQRMELDICLSLAGQILLTRGYGDLGVKQYFRQALQLSQLLKDSHAFEKAQLGVYYHHLMRAEFGDAQRYLPSSQTELDLGTSPLSRLLWQCAKAILHFYQGDMKGCAALMLDCLQKCDHIAEVDNLAHSPRIMCAMYRAYCLWALGQTESACQLALQGVELAKQHSLKLASTQAFSILAMLVYCRGEWDEALKASQTAVNIGQHGQYELWAAHASFLGGAARFQLGMLEGIHSEEIKKGLLQMAQADQVWVNKGSLLTRSFYLCTQAQCHMEHKQYAQSQSCLDQAYVLIEQHNERYFCTEAQRIQAALWMTTKNIPQWENRSQAVLTDAYQDACNRSLYSLALRVALSMLEWEKVTQTKGAWLSESQPAETLMSQCLANIEPQASSLDVLRARAYLASKNLLTV